jgi:2'-5' RNA ligase
VEQYRVFLALRLSPQTRARLASVTRLMMDTVKAAAAGRPAHPVAIRPVAQANFHLTLSFLGEVSADRLPAIRHAVSITTARRRRPAFVVRGVGTFPGRGTPRVVWAGVDDVREKDVREKDDCEKDDCGAVGGDDAAAIGQKGEAVEDVCSIAGTARLLERSLAAGACGGRDLSGIAGTARLLEQSLAAAACGGRDSRAGAPRGARRPFSAHVTLGRVRLKPRFDRRGGSERPDGTRHAPASARGASWVAVLRAFVEDHQESVFGREVVNAISVMRSRLGPRGPAYEEIDRLEFRG